MSLKLPVSRRSNTAEKWRRSANDLLDPSQKPKKPKNVAGTVIKKSSANISVFPESLQLKMPDSPDLDGGNDVTYNICKVSNDGDEIDKAKNSDTAQSLLNKKYYIHDVEDVVDRPPTNHVHASYTYFDIFLGIVSIGSYLFDVGSDVFVAVIYYKDEHWMWFGLTVTFIVVPSITISLFSLTWYLQDRNTDGNGIIKNGPCRWVSRFMLLFLQLGPVLRYIDTMIFGMRSKRANSEADRELKLLWYREKLWEDTDSALLRLIECFMEAAPQLTLQLYIMTEIGAPARVILVIGQSISCITSLGSISWALATYQRALRLSLDTKANLTYRALFVMFLWRLFTVGARVLSFALFASCFGHWVFVVVGSHYIVMLAWIRLQNTRFCVNKCGEFFFNAVAAAISIFCFFNLVEGHTRVRYVIFYTMVYLENMAMIVPWYCIRSTETDWYIKPAMFVVLLLFFVGIALQLFYYLCCHPNNTPENHALNGPIRCWVPCSELWKESFSERSKSTNIHVHGNGEGSLPVAPGSSV